MRLAAAVAAERPLLLGVDDLHWGDVPSLRVLLYFARRIEDLPALLCVTTRPVSGRDPASPLIDALLSEAGRRVLHPAPLTLGATTAIVSDALGAAAEPAFCGACHEATGGNPLLLRELLRGLLTEGIEPSAGRVEAILGVGGHAISRTVRMRLAHLPATATELARAAAVLGEQAPIATAARVAGLDTETAFDAAAGLGQLEILTGGSEATFVHPLVREAILYELEPSELASVHELAAEVLIETGASPERVANHLLHAPARGSADRARILRHAGNAAVAHGDPLAGTKFLVRALEEPAGDADRAAILLELAFAERGFDIESAREHRWAALELIEDPQARAAAAVQLAYLLPSIDPRRAIEVVEPHLGSLADPEARMRAQAVMLTAALLAPDLLPRARELADALRPQTASGGAAARMATSLVGYLDALENRPTNQLIARIEGTITEPLDPPEILGQLVLGAITLVAADSPAALRASEQWSRLADQSGLAGFANVALMCRAHALLARGRLADAVADGRDGVEVAETYVGGVALNWTGAALAEALIEQGELDEAARLIDRLTPSPIPQWTLDLHGLLGCRARLAALRGDRAGALERTLELGRRCEAAGLRNPALAPWRSRAALLLAESPDGADRARTLATDEVDLARIWGAPRALGRALTTLALVAPHDDAVALHTDAVDVLEDSPAQLELARAKLELGVALRGRGQRAAAREPLRAAAELAESCGAAPLADRAQAELVGTGARPRRRAMSGPNSLTPQERRVAAVAADGLSNQEIAERLYLTPRTVESHLSNAYRKLGISSRSQLTRLLER
jgi:DNA-binding CsgD family transcriptional regulator